MKLLNILLITLLLGSTKTSISQRIGKFQFDSSSCLNRERSIHPTDRNVLKAIFGAEEFLKSILGKEIVNKNVWFDCFQSRETWLGNYSKNFNHPKRLGEDTCYDFYFLVKENNYVIGNFQLLVDKNGRIRFDESYPDYNKPELIKGFKKHFLQEFSFSYEKALMLGKEKGFTINPLLQCTTENKFLTNTKKEEFVKVKYIWCFYMVKEGGDVAILDINAETGKIERENYVPGMPK